MNDITCTWHLSLETSIRSFLSVLGAHTEYELSCLYFILYSLIVVESGIFLGSSFFV
jgi:hypothetical protein